MPAVATVAALLQAAADVATGALHVVAEPAAVAVAQRSLESSGLPLVDAFVATGGLRDHELLWMGDGRITVGHLAVLAERVGAGRLRLILFDGTIGADWSWTQRDEAMARRLLASSPPDARTLVVAGNAHTPTSATKLGVPMGARLAAVRPGVREVRVRYRGGAFYNCELRRFRRDGPGRERPPLLALHRGELVLTLPSATEAVVPQRTSSLPVRQIR